MADNSSENNVQEEVMLPSQPVPSASLVLEGLYVIPLVFKPTESED